MAEPRIPTMTGQIAQADSPRFLGNPVVVFGLIRDYVGGMLTRAGQAGEGEMTAQAAAALDQQAAKALIEVLAGRDTAYVSLGRWNSAPLGEGGLRSWLHARLGEVAPQMVSKAPDGPIEALAAHLMLETYRVLREQVGEPDEGALRDRVMGLIYEGTALALGMPQDALEDAIPPQA